METVAEKRRAQAAERFVRGDVEPDVSDRPFDPASARRAYRAMLVDPGSGALTSVRGDLYWPPPPGAFAVAGCEQGHEAPAEGCGCGWYGVRNLAALTAWLTSWEGSLRLPPGRVALTVSEFAGRSLPPRARWGVVGALDPPTTRRWEYVRVARVHLPGESGGAAEALHAAYGVSTLVHPTEGAVEFYASVVEVEAAWEDAEVVVERG